MNRWEKYSELLAAGKKKTLEDKTSEAHAKLHIMAKDELQILEVDHGILEERQGVKKCDYMVVGTRSNSTHMIELKGANDMKKACRQIKDTLDSLLQDSELRTYVEEREILDAYIVSPKRQNVPNVVSREEKELARTLVRGNKRRPKDMFDLIHFVRVVQKQKAVSNNGRQIIISGNAPLQLS